MISSKTEYAVVGETVQRRTVHVEEVVDAEEFLNTLVSQKGYSSGLLPQLTCRFHRQVGNKNLYVFEQPPQLRTLRWRFWPYWPIDCGVVNPTTQQHPTPAPVVAAGDAPAAPPVPEPFVGPPEPVDSAELQFRRYTLAFPYCVFIIRTKEAAVLSTSCQYFWRPAPLCSVDDPLFAPGISNVYNNGPGPRGCTICFGTARALPALPPDTPATPSAQAAATVAAFWSADFNKDLFDNFVDLASRDLRFKNPVTWQKYSLEDALFPLCNPTYTPVTTLKEAVGWLP